jgi:hypothetical protein
MRNPFLALAGTMSGLFSAGAEMPPSLSGPSPQPRLPVPQPKRKSSGQSPRYASSSSVQPPRYASSGEQRRRSRQLECSRQAMRAKYKLIQGFKGKNGMSMSPDLLARHASA